MSAASQPSLQPLLQFTIDFCTESVNCGEYDAALHALNRGLRLFPGDVEMLLQRGQLRLFMDQPEGAASDFNRALEADSRLLSAHLGLTRCHLRNGAWPLAREAIQRAKAIEPWNREVEELLAEVKAAEALHPAETVSEPAPPSRITVRAVEPASVDEEQSRKARETWKNWLSEAGGRLRDVAAPDLDEKHLRNSKVVPSRDHILHLLPKGGTCAEVGTQSGGFAERIMAILSPKELHLFDLDFTPFDRQPFRQQLADGTVNLHQGDSAELMAEMPDRHFDFIYIDADHSYDAVVRDLAQAALKIKESGWIVCNDYTLYSPLENIKYGVYRAVNEFCLQQGYEIVYLGLQLWGYHDVALRKISAPTVRQANGRCLKPEAAATEQAARPLSAGVAPANGCSRGPAPTNGLVTSRHGGQDHAPVPSEQADAQIQTLARLVGDDWKQQPYYDEAEQYMEKQWRETIWPFIREADFSCVLDLAAGHGRNGEKLKTHARKIYVVDINQENIDFCRRRFAGDSRFAFIKNDGYSLDAIEPNTISLVYCFDAMVHFDSDVVRCYLREFQRVMRPGGLGFCHHSNYSRNPGGNVHENPGWRNFMTQQQFAHYCVKEGFRVLKSQVIDWTGPASDCVTLFRKS